MVMPAEVTYVISYHSHTHPGAHTHTHIYSIAHKHESAVASNQTKHVKDIYKTGR